MAATRQLADDRAAEISGSACDEYFHGSATENSPRDDAERTEATDLKNAFLRSVASDLFDAFPSLISSE
jgi:hypothetical protein